MKKSYHETQKLGELFEKKRLEKQISIDKAAELTKIRKNYLVALENDAFDLLPAKVYTTGFIKRYSKVLGINPEIPLALYRRDYKEEKQNKKKNEKKTLTKSINLTPGKLIPIIVTLIIILFLFFIYTKISTVTSPPGLELTDPIPLTQGNTNTYETTKNTITIRGKVEIGSQLEINGNKVNTNNLEIFEVDNLELNSGENIFEIRATNDFGSESIIILKVNKLEDKNSTKDEDVNQNEMLIEVIIGEREANLLVEVDGTEVQNWVEPAGSMKTFKANNSVAIQTPRPDSVRVAINGEEKLLETTDKKTWIIFEGKVIEQE